MATTELTPQERRCETERIHASPTVLILAAIGLAFRGVGKLLGTVEIGPTDSQLGSTLAFVGTAVLVIALVLHVDHLSYRLGRSAVVLIILSAIVLGVGSLLEAFNVSSINPLWFSGVSYALGGVGLAMVAVHKKVQMKATLADYAAGAPWQARVTVHASFLSLITGASGFVLYGIGTMGMAGNSGRGAFALLCLGGLLGTIGLISHIEHLVPRIGLAAVIAAILAPLAWGVAPLLDAGLWHVCLGIGSLLGALSCALAFQKKISTDR